MSDLISRKVLLEALKKSRKCHAQDGRELELLCRCENIVNEQPPVEAVPVVHGEWICVPSSDMATGRAYECSNCKKMRYGSFLPPFCQMCGADMRKKV